MRRITILFAAFLFYGCSTSGTSIPIGEPGNYPSTEPDSIVLLVSPPDRPHKVIALVEGVAATDDYFTRERTEAAALNAMREEAARVGANAIVLTGKGSQPYGQVTTGTTTGSATTYGGTTTGFATTTSTTMGWEKITFSGTAVVYVGDRDESS